MHDSHVTSRWTTDGDSGVEFRYYYNSEGALARVEQYYTELSNGAIVYRGLIATEHYYYDTTDRLIRVLETDEDGNTYIDRSDFITGSATMMIRTENDTLRQNAWNS